MDNVIAQNPVQQLFRLTANQKKKVRKNENNRLKLDLGNVADKNESDRIGSNRMDVYEPRYQILGLNHSPKSQLVVVRKENGGAINESGEEEKDNKQDDVNSQDRFSQNRNQPELSKAIEQENMILLDQSEQSEGGGSISAAQNIAMDNKKQFSLNGSGSQDELDNNIEFQNWTKEAKKDYGFSQFLIDGNKQFDVKNQINSLLYDEQQNSLQQYQKNLDVSLNASSSAEKNEQKEDNHERGNHDGIKIDDNLNVFVLCDRDPLQEGIAQQPATRGQFPENSRVEVGGDIKENNDRKRRRSVEISRKSKNPLEQNDYIDEVNSAMTKMDDYETNLKEKNRGGRNSDTPRFAKGVIGTALSGDTLSQGGARLHDSHHYAISHYLRTAQTAINNLQQERIDHFSLQTQSGYIASGQESNAYNNGFWISGFGGNQIEKNTNGKNKAQFAGTAIGLERYFDNLLGGVAVSYFRGVAGYQQLKQSSSNYIVSFYGMGRFDNLVFNGSIYLGQSKIKSTRFLPAQQIARARFKNKLYGATVGAAYEFKYNGQHIVTPSVGFKYGCLVQPSYSETGAGALSQQIAKKTLQSYVGLAAIKYSYLIANQNMDIIPSLKIGFSGDLKKPSSSFNTKFSGDDDFSKLQTTVKKHNIWLIAPSLVLKNDRFDINLTYHFERSRKLVAHSAGLRVLVKF
jgi:hypothetical protein